MPTLDELQVKLRPADREPFHGRKNKLPGGFSSAGLSHVQQSQVSRTRQIAVSDGGHGIGVDRL